MPDQPTPVANRLRGHAAFVTGSGRGLGRAIAERLAAEGAGVAVADLDLAAAEDAAAAIRSSGGRALAVAADVRDPAAVERAMHRATEEYGLLDSLVTNAGLVFDARL